MAHLNNVRDGRASKVYLLTHGTEKAAEVKLGGIYVVSKIAAEGSKLGNLAVGDYYVAIGKAAIELAEDDELIEVTPHFIGGATDKDLSFEKSTTSITCDKDEAENVTSNGVVAISGSITAYDLIQTGDTAANMIKQRFNKMVSYSIDGAPTAKEMDRTMKDVLMFVWDARDLDEGEFVAIDFVPAFLSSQGHNSAYGSGQTFPINFTGADTDEAGHRRSTHILLYQKEIGDAIAKWDAS